MNLFKPGFFAVATAQHGKTAKRSAHVLFPRFGGKQAARDFIGSFLIVSRRYFCL